MPTVRKRKKADEQPLATYRRKRDFTSTKEPAGERVPKPGANRFVVQRHRARRLHYDLRLEVDGVLVSWAVPKGPTLDPKARHLAVHVEDHPIEYIDFEGTIPGGQYGGGDVIVWDKGTWSLGKGDDPAKAIADGDLHFDLEGEKLHGRFVLVRRGAGNGAKEEWLLLHKRDESARDGWDPEHHPASVKSGRTNDEVAAEPDAAWHSDRPATQAETSLRFAGPTAEELQALDELGPKGGMWHLQGRSLKLTNLDKVLFPAGRGEEPITKRDLIRHYATIGPWMLPYLVRRPVNLHRYPNGVDRPGFWHKELASHAPDWISRWQNDDADPGETGCYAVADSVPTLVWLANFGAIELHPWTSTVRDVQQPTWALVDIDPGQCTTFEDLLLLARLHRTALEHLGVRGGPKLSGQRGIQIWIPVADGYGFDRTRAWVEGLSRTVGAMVPDLVSWSWQKAERHGLARLDYTQNAINKTLVAPFSARPRPGAPLSVPITWDDLDDPDIAPDRWTIRTVGDRVETAGDPLAPLIGMQQTLPDVAWT